VLEGDEWSAARPGPHFTPGKDPLPMAQEADVDMFLVVSLAHTCNME